METVRIFLSGPVQYEPDKGMGWREKAEEIFTQVGDDRDVRIKVLNPTKFFSYDEAKHQSDTQVKEYYLDQIRHSRVVLCNLSNTKTSPGTAQELQFARDCHVQVIGFGTEEVYPWLKVDCQAVFPSLLQAIDYILEYYC